MKEQEAGLEAELSAMREQQLERLRENVLINIGEQLKKDSVDEATRQKSLEYIKHYLDNLK